MVLREGVVGGIGNWIGGSWVTETRGNYKERKAQQSLDDCGWTSVSQRERKWHRIDMEVGNLEHGIASPNAGTSNSPLGIVQCIA
jgi:hypothetical protein